MDQLVFVAVVGRSLAESLTAADELGLSPGGPLVERFLDGDESGAELYAEWEKALRQLARQAVGLALPAVPFAELAPLAADEGRLLKRHDTVRLVLMHGTDETVQERQARSLTLIGDYLSAWAAARNLPVHVTVQRLDIGYPLTDRFDSDVAKARAVIMDYAAQVAANWPQGVDATGKNSVSVLVNGVSGANASGEALSWAAGVLGWDVAYASGLTARPASRLHPGAGEIAQAWCRAQSLVAKTNAALDDVRKRPRPDQVPVDVIVTELMKEVARDQLLPFVVVQAEPTATVRARMSRLGDHLFAESAEGVTQYTSACAHLLRRHGADATLPYRDAAGHYASLLADLVEFWSRSQLFASNLVREMVLHGEGHAQTVDRHLADICDELLREGVLSVADVFHLALAAWLHDWGHSGATFLLDREWAMLVDPIEIRDAHGLISRERIAKMAGQCGLSLDTSPVLVQDIKWRRQVLGAARPWVMTVVAHHQGWTSTGDAEPAIPDSLAGLGLPIERLWGSWQASCDLAGVDPTELSGLRREIVTEDPEIGADPRLGHVAGQLQLLIAIFRIADAADVGLHRVPHREPGALRDRLYDEIAQHLARFPQLNSGKAQRLRFLLMQYASNRLHRADSRAGTPALAKEIEAAGRKGTPDPTVIAQLSRDYATDEDCVRRATAYVCHAVKQPDYFELHSTVLGVHFQVKYEAGRWQLIPMVAPAPGADREGARAGVDKDVARELGAGSQGEEKGRKDVLRRVLEANRLSVGAAQLSEERERRSW